MNIEQAYERDLDKPGLRRFHELLRMGRSFGFPMACMVGSLPESSQLRAAVLLLLSIEGSATSKDVPGDLVLDPRSALHRDACLLLETSKATTASILHHHERSAAR